MRRILVLLVMALTIPASAGAVPIMVPYSGLLSENGTPVDGTRDITVRIYDGPTDGIALYTESFTAVPVSSGVFQLVISAPSYTWSGEDRWAGISINAGSELTPRTRIGSVPYALTAKEASHSLTAEALTLPLSTLVTIQSPLPDVRNNTTVTAAGVWWVVPGRTLNFWQFYPTSRLKITYQDTLGSNSQFFSGCEWRILLDGVPVLTFSDPDIERTPQSWAMSNAAHVAWATASAGAHTITVENRGYRGAWTQGTSECLMGWGNSGNFISVEEIP